VHRLLVIVTDLGDSAVTLPLALLVLVVLLVARERRIALRWLLMVAGCGAAIGALKLVFGACTLRLGFLDIVSPSGHTAMSTGIYGSLALLIGPPLRPTARHVTAAAAAVLIVAIAVSRVLLHVHDTPEIILGLAVGLAAVVWFHVALRREPPRGLPLAWLTLGGLAVVVAMHGTRANVEPDVRALAGWLRLSVPWCR
jgi:membrane-associated phospholipid phosphatase